MSEVIGQILVFGIVSILLVLSMLAFNQAQLGARDRVVELSAQSAATRVAGIVVQTSLIAEQHGVATTVTFLVDLPQRLEGLDYRVSLNVTAPAHVDVTIPSLQGSPLVTAALFSADASGGGAAPTQFDLCPGSVSGGRLHVRFDARALAPGGCPTGTHTYALFLESTP